MIINFFCIGAQKAGTTTLFNILKQHPEIYIPKQKEAHYFDFNDRYNNGIEWYYKTFYDGWNGEKIVGSITPEYGFIPNVPKRIAKELGTSIKFIFILRQPVKRAVSHYNMSVGRKFETITFYEAIEFEKERIKKGDFELNHFSYISRGKYLSQINRFFNYFNKDQILFLEFEKDIVNNISSTVLRIQEFLDLPMVELKQNYHSNKAFKYKSNILTKYLLQRNKSSLIKLLPSTIRKSIKNRLLGINKVKNNNPFKLSEEEIDQLFNKYFITELDYLQDVTNLDLTHWVKQVNN